MPPRVRPIYVATTPAPTFGLLHPAAPGTATDVAVLMCAPFGWDDAATYRSRRAWAEQLALAGHATLRFDLPGTGDSGGSPADADLVQAWIASVAATAAWLREQTGARRVAAIGLGLGGLLACVAKARGAAIDDLVLWGVPARGRTLVREMRAFASLIDAELQSREAGEPEDDPLLAEGALAVSGFVLSPQTAAALAALDVTAEAVPQAGAARVLMLERAGTGVDSRLREHLDAAGAQVSVVPGPSYTAITDHPQRRRPPIPEFGTVTEWLGEAASPASVKPAAIPPEPPRIELDAGGVAIAETPITLERPFGNLFGVIARPAGGDAAGPCLVFLNSGAIRHIGPNRMWVEIARRWAAQGVSSVRLDLEGIGEADGDSDVYEDTGSLYADRLTDQVLRALDDLEAIGSRPFILAGLCSGAFWAFHAALRDERVEAALLLNLRAVWWDDSLDAARDARRAARLIRGTGVSWRKALRGLSLRRLMSFARWAGAAVAGLPLRAVRRRAEVRRVVAALDQLRDASKSTLFVFSEGEDLYEELDRDGVWDRLESWPNVRLERVPGFDHDLRPLPSQRRAHELLDEALERVLAGAAGREA